MSSRYWCAKCEQPSSMMGHWVSTGHGEGYFSCEEKDKNMDKGILTPRTDGEREAYAQGYQAALEVAISKCKHYSSASSVELALNNIREGFIAARG